MNQLQKLANEIKKKPIIIAVIVFIVMSLVVWKIMPQASIVVFNEEGVAYVEVISPAVGSEVSSYTIPLSIAFTGAGDTPFMSIPTFTAVIVGADGWSSNTMSSSVGEYFATGYLNKEVSLPAKDQSYTINMAFTARDSETGETFDRTTSSTFSVKKVAVTPSGSLSLASYITGTMVEIPVTVSVGWSASDGDGDLTTIILELWDTGNSKKIYGETVYAGGETLSGSGSKTIDIISDGTTGDFSYSFFLTLKDASGLERIVEKSFSISWYSDVVVTTTDDPHYEETTTDTSMPVVTPTATGGFELLLIVPVALVLYKIKKRDD